jgi:hypothetical protein
MLMLLPLIFLPKALQTAKQNAVINEVEVNFVEDIFLNPKSNIQNSKSL